MRIVFADPDRNLLGLVRRSLEAEGHTVRVASDARAVEVALAGRAPDLIVIDVDLAVRSKSALRPVQSSPTRVVVASSRAPSDTIVRNVQSLLGTTDHLSKPFSLLDIGTTLSAYVPGTTTGGAGGLLGRLGSSRPTRDRRATRPPLRRTNRSLVPQTGGPVVFPVAAQLAGLWLQAATGRIHLRRTTPRIGRPVLLHQGGLVDPRDAAMIEVALSGAELRFTAEAVAGPGDRGRFFQTLWVAAYVPGEARFAEQHAFEAVEVDELDSIAPSLSPTTRAVLGAADPSLPLGELLVAQGATPAGVSADLMALHRLGLVRFRPPVASSRRRPRPLDRLSSRSSSAKSSSSSARSRRRPPRDSQSTRPRSSSRRRTAPTEVGTERQSAERRGRAAVASRMRRFGEGAALVHRLERELSRLQGATPAEVLGIPKDADRAMVDAVGERMRKRYGDIAEDPRADSRARELSQQVLELVDKAVGRWGHDFVRAAGDPTTSREAVILKQAQVLIEAADFARADRMLQKARELAMANPEVLAALGWARFHNSSRPKSAREEEGRDYLLLAEQFDPSDVGISWQVVQVLHRMGNLRGARLRATRIAAREPKHDAARWLVDNPAEAPAD